MYSQVDKLIPEPFILYKHINTHESMHESKSRTQHSIQISETIESILFSNMSL